MRRLLKTLTVTVISLVIAYAVYLVGWNAGHTAGILEAVTENLKQAFRGPLPPRGSV